MMNVIMKKRLASGFGDLYRIFVNFVLWLWAVSVPISSLYAYGLSPKFLLFGIFPSIVASILFMTVTQVSHVQRETQMPHATDDPDFFKRQAKTSLDYSCDSNVWSFLTGGLNTQSLHHVLPAVHSSHYCDLYPKFRDVCIRHGCPPPQEQNISAAIVEHLAYVYSLGEQFTLPVPEM